MRFAKILFVVGFCGATFSAFAQPLHLICADELGFDECEYVNCGICDLNGLLGSTALFGPDPDGDLDDVLCGPVNNARYFPFYAAVSDMTITVTLSGCTVNSGIDLGVFAICDNPLIGCEPGDSTNSTTLSLNGLTVGAWYLLVIDVDANSICGFSISVDPPNGTGNSIPPDTAIEGDFTVCPNAIANYHIIPPTHADILWSLPPGAEILSQTNAFNNIEVQWGSIGGDLCFTATAPCIDDFTLCQNVTVTPIPLTILPPVMVCAEDAPYELPWGNTTSASGVFSHTMLSFQACDSTLRQTVTILPANIQTLPPVELCENGCLTKCGETFCGYGNFSVTCQSYLGCDSVINFSIVPPNLVADIQGGGSITCSNSMVELSSVLSSGVKIWTNSAGQQVGTGSLLTVNSPGTYFLTVTMVLGGESCMQIDSVVIPLNIAPPNVMATGAVLGCDTLPALVHVDSLPGPASYSWAGPNGFVSSLQNPEVTTLGVYVVTVVNLSNGCSAKDTVLVTCCPISAGTLDSTMLTVCGEKNLLFNFHGDQILGIGDSLVFILYSDPSDPFGSILLYSDTTIFPFVPGLQQLDSIYYVAAFVGSMLPDTSNSFQNSCWALSVAQPVRWVSKPSITVTQGPELVCKGDCMDLLFQFTGTPPFYFHFEITENGVLMLAQDIVSDTLQKTITICPAAFIQPQGHGALNFNVNYFQDAVCNCND